MPSYADNFTPRYRVRYKVAGVEHVMQFRGPRGHSAFLMENDGRNAALAVFNNNLSHLCDDHEWISAEVALTDEDIFVPAATPVAVVGTAPIAGFSPIDKIISSTWSGRAPGSRARVVAFGFFWPISTAGNISGDGLITAAEVAGIGTTAAALGGVARAGSGGIAIYYNRITVKVNDKLLKLVRRGIIT